MKAVGCGDIIVGGGTYLVQQVRRHHSWWRNVCGAAGTKVAAYSVRWRWKRHQTALRGCGDRSVEEATLAVASRKSSGGATSMKRHRSVVLMWVVSVSVVSNAVVSFDSGVNNGGGVGDGGSSATTGPWL